MYTFHTHPFKDQILQMWEDGKNPCDVERFLLDKGKEYYISRPTLYKHYNNYKRANKSDDKKKERQEVLQFIQRLEKELWDTINACNTRIKDKTLSPKDWQYYDQQKQAAIDKLMKLKEVKGSSDDVSLAMSKFFNKFMAEQAKLEQKAESEAKENNDQQPEETGQASSTEDILPRADVSV